MYLSEVNFTVGNELGKYMSRLVTSTNLDTYAIMYGISVMSINAIKARRPGRFLTKLVLVCNLNSVGIAL